MIKRMKLAVLLGWQNIKKNKRKNHSYFVKTILSDSDKYLKKIKNNSLLSYAFIER